MTFRSVHIFFPTKMSISSSSSSMCLLLMIAFAISAQAGHSLGSTDLKRHSKKTAEVKPQSTSDLIPPLQPRQECTPEPRLCAAATEHLDFLQGKMKVSNEVVSSESINQNDDRCTLCKSCVPDECQRPNCKCSNTTIPGKMSRNETPIIIIVTMQDAVNNATYKAFLELFEGLRNPNGCPATGTYFVSHPYTDYFLVQSLHSKRHEIGDGTVSGTSKAQDYWRKADCHTWKKEFEDAMTILKNLANVTDVRGFRAPYLQPGGDAQMFALEMLQQQQQQQQQQQEQKGGESFVYDASRVSIRFSDASMLLWPYTYDYNSTQDCVTQPCPRYCHKGIWQVPLLTFRDRFNKVCTMLDGCNVQTYNDVFRLLYDRFSDRFDSNKAPLILSMDSSWITNPFKFKGTRLFLEHALSYKEVYVVSAGQALDWTRNPVPLSNITHFEPWNCNQPGPPVCAESTTKNCTYDSKGRPTTIPKNVKYQFRTCAASCPSCYPWLGNPQGLCRPADIISGFDI